MDYYVVEKSLQVLIEELIQLGEVQQRKIGEICMGVLLAGSSYLTKIARWLNHDSAQDSRVQWMRRLLQSEYMCQEYVYYPFVKHALSGHKAEKLHLIMDRSPLPDKSTDLLSLNLHFRKRAIPLAWEFMPHGMSGYERHVSLIERCHPLLPDRQAIVFHGDSEFGGVPLIQYLRHLKWDVVVGQSSKTCYRQYPDGQWHALSSLPVSKQRSVYLEDIELTKLHRYGLLNLFAFYKPRFSKHHRKQNVIYCATSLPITHAIRRIGRRRWGIECCFKDFKSAGWQLHLSHLCHSQRREGLMTVLSMLYLWTTCLGRWLCKLGQRSRVDAKSNRHLSLFRIGWDWLVHQYRNNKPCPTLLTLYQ